MATGVVGGHSRDIGKTSVVAGLIAQIPEMHWTALKVTQYGHGICASSGGDCDCATASHMAAVTEERDRSGDSDSSRFLVSGAEQSFWVRTRQGYLAEAMPRVRQVLAGAQNAIIESNSIIRFLQPDLYLVVLDPSIQDFKDSSRLFLDRASALLVREDQAEQGSWSGVSRKLMQGKPVLPLRVPGYVTPELVAFVRNALAPAVHG
ncbi:MAG TPA: hypothetical protein VF786_13680 [Terriglobales bacterium]